MKKYTILVVEDEPSLLKVLEVKFQDEGFEVIIARNGLDGLSVAREKHPDLILLDIVMPKMDGVTMLKLLREDSWGKDVPVILLTNLSESSKVSDAVKEGVTDYLIKSDWKLEDVVKKVRQKLE